MLDPPPMHSAKQQLIAEAFLHPGLEELCVACGTKFGKTRGAATALALGAWNKPRTRWRWLAPIYEQAKIGYDVVSRILPPPPAVKQHHSEPSLRIVANDSYMRFLHAQNPAMLEGDAIDGYVFDEAAKMKEEAIHAAETTTTVTRGPKVFLSTPLGKNFFYRRCMAALEEMRRAHAEGRRPKKMFIRAKTADNPYVPRESIERARRELPARLFRQYYEAEFEDEGTVFAGWRACLKTPELDLYGDQQRWTHATAGEREVVVGVDWAKSVDWTVFIAIDPASHETVAFERFHKLTYVEAIRQLVRFCRQFRGVRIVMHDKTGVGAAIDDQLAYTDLPFIGITFTQAWKSEAVSRLITSLEHKRLGLPAWPQLGAELDAYEVSVGKLGGLSYSSPSGQHDDCVSALILAHTALLQYGDGEPEIRFLEDLGKPAAAPPADSIEAYYQDLIDQEQ